MRRETRERSQSDAPDAAKRSGPRKPTAPTGTRGRGRARNSPGARSARSRGSGFGETRREDTSAVGVAAPVPPWTILLVAGCSGVGKSRVARRIARRYGASVLQVDDVRLALQRITSPAEQPALHYFLREFAVAQRSVDELLRGYLGIAETLAPALETILAHHLSLRRTDRLIIEGDGILPQLATLTCIRAGMPDGTDLLVGGRLRGVVVYESDPARILANMRARGRGIEASPPAEQEAWAQGSWRYGLWLRDEAVRLGVPALPARPYASLVARALAALT